MRLRLYWNGRRTDVAGQVMDLIQQLPTPGGGGRSVRARTLPVGSRFDHLDRVEAALKRQ